MVQPLPQDTGSLHSQAQGTFPVGGGVPTSILSVPCRIWACSHCCMEGMGPVGAMGWGEGGVVQQAGLVRAVSHHWLSLPGWDRHSHPASRCTCRSHLGSTKQPTSTAKPTSLTQGHLVQHLAWPGAHLQQARTGVGQAAMGPITCVGT